MNSRSRSLANDSFKKLSASREATRALLKCGGVPPSYNSIHYCSDNQYAVSIKEDTVYLCLHSPKTTMDTTLIRRIQERQYAVFKLYGNKIFWEISNVVPTPRNSNTPYPTTWILYDRMDDPNISMKEYIRLEEEKAQKCGKVFNWETAKYGKIWYDKYIHDLTSVETKFPAIAFNDEVSSEKTLSCEPVLNSENDNEKVNLPSLPSPEPKISCFDDLDFFKDFKNEFPAIVYNDAQTSKSDLLTKPILSPQHIDEFDLNDKTSLSGYDEEEQNVLYINDLFPFNIIHPDDLKSEKDNDDNEIDIIQSSGDMALPLRDQRQQYLRYEGLQYIDDDIADFKMRLARIYRKEVHRVQVFDFGGLPKLIAEGLSARMLIEHKDAQGVSLFTSRAWRRIFDIKGPLVHELILEFFSTFRFGEAILDLDTLGALQFQLGGARRRLSWRQFILALGLHTDKEMQTIFPWHSPILTNIRDPILRLCHRLKAYSIGGRSQAPEKVTVTDLFYLRGMEIGSVNIPYLLARYLRFFAAGRKSEALISGGQFVARLAEHFRLLTEERC
ncbi:hypothetical protein Tco_0446568 [Tanacetum coccineum]